MNRRLLDVPLRRPALVVVLALLLAAGGAFTVLAQGRLVQGRLEEAWRAAVATNRAAASMTPVAVYVFEGHAG